MSNQIIEDLCSKIKDALIKVSEKPQQYEDVTLDDGFECMVAVKPKFMLKELGYDYKIYEPKVIVSILKNVLNELNNFYGDSGIYVNCNVPNKTVQDFVFVITLP
jgi:hypothetical protein